MRCDGKDNEDDNDEDDDEDQDEVCPADVDDDNDDDDEDGEAGRGAGTSACVAWYCAILNRHSTRNAAVRGRRAYSNSACSSMSTITG